MSNTVVSKTLALAEELISLSSVTPQDKGCQDRLIELLSPLGFVCETIQSGDVTNLWARKGTTQPLLVFAGHTDVVPTGPRDQWQSDPFLPSHRDGKLYGRARSSSTRKSFTCVDCGMSEISSRNKVPPSASSKRPSSRSAAPVKAPFS